MEYIFNIDEIFEIAEQMEKNGAKFYQKAAENASDGDTKKFLLELADMEVDHKKTFSAMRSQIKQKENHGDFFDPQGDAALYLRALADTRVFFEREIDVSSAREVLKEAVLAEKDSIAFYLGIKDMVPDDLGKSDMDAIIKEEMSHIKLLSEKLIALRD